MNDQDKAALFSDGTPFYRSFVKVEDGWYAKIRLRTIKHSDCRYYFRSDTQLVRMEFDFADTLFDYYVAHVFCHDGGMSYHFEIRWDDGMGVFDKLGFGNIGGDRREYYMNPSFDVPQWAYGAVMYQIFTDRFCNGDRSNDVLTDEYAYGGCHTERVSDWNQLPSSYDVSRFYGGDLQGILNKLPYLKDLGVEVLYLNPIFVSPSNHKYDTQDYEYVDPHLAKIVDDGGSLLKVGDDDNTHASRYIRRVTSKENLEASNEFFAHFVSEVHKAGMKVILDGVFNHCGSFNRWMDREGIYSKNGHYPAGAFKSADSPYRDFFRFTSDQWPDNNDYEKWWGFDTLPKLNYEDSQKLCDKILEIGQKWVSPPYNCDGWRLDVAADLGHSEGFNHEFWKKFRKAVRSANPDALILAEDYGDSSAWLRGDQWDSIMNYSAFMEPFTWFFTGMEKHSDSGNDYLYNNYEHFHSTMQYNMANLQYKAKQVAMNELSNHDHSRFLTRTNRRVGRIGSAGQAAAGQGVSKCVMREAVIAQMTWPGAPTVYYGDEAGMCGWTDPDNRRTYPWGHEDRELIRFHKDVIAIHKEIPALRRGSFKLLGGRYGCMYYARFDEDDAVLTVINNNESAQELDIPVWLANILEGETMHRLILTSSAGVSRQEEAVHVEGWYVHLRMPPLSAAIYRIPHKHGKKKLENE